MRLLHRDEEFHFSEKTIVRGQVSENINQSFLVFSAASFSVLRAPEKCGKILVSLGIRFRKRIITYS